jgi:hypothetical protein
MASKFTADSAGIVSVSRPVAAKQVTVAPCGTASRVIPLARNDMKTTLGGIVSRTDRGSDPDQDGH